MKIRLLPFCLATALLLSGCVSMLERSYSSAGAHVDYTLTEEDASILRAESYRGLVDAILYFVEEHRSSGTIRLYNYTRPVEADLTAARREVLEQTPLGAFAVRDISCQASRIVSYYEVNVSIGYSRTAGEIRAIRPVTGATAIQNELSRALAAFAGGLTLRISYFNGDEQSLLAQVVRAYYDTPLAAFGLPAASVALYPATGNQRIAHFSFQWEEGVDRLTQQAEQLLTLARQLLAQAPAAGERYTLKEVAAVMERVYLHDPDGAADAYSALTGQPTDHLGWALGLELLCQLAQVEATLVAGAYGGQGAYWLIVADQEGYRHLLPEGGTDTLYTDEALSRLGYSWNQESYPRCIDYSAEMETE